MSHLTITLHVIRSNFNWLLPINLLTPKENQKAVQNADLMASFAHQLRSWSQASAHALQPFKVDFDKSIQMSRLHWRSP